MSGPPVLQLASRFFDTHWLSDVTPPSVSIAHKKSREPGTVAAPCRGIAGGEKPASTRTSDRTDGARQVESVHRLTSSLRAARTASKNPRFRQAPKAILPIPRFFIEATARFLHARRRDAAGPIASLSRLRSRRRQPGKKESDLNDPKLGGSRGARSSDAPAALTAEWRCYFELSKDARPR